MKSLWNLIKSLFGIGSSSPSGKVIFATDFLRGWNGGNCPLFILSAFTTDDQAKSCIKWLKDGGYTVINPYFWNAKDGDGKHAVDVLKDSAIAAKRLKMCRDAGLKVVPILFADDSKAITSQSLAKLQTMVADALKLYGKQLAAVCVALEPNDSFGSDNTVNALGNLVVAQGFRAGIHTNPVLRGTGFDAHQVRFGKQGWCHFILIQTTFPGNPTTPERMKMALRETKRHCPGKKVVAFEYAFDAIGLGDAAIDEGCDGIGNEASRDMMKRLPKWV